jgi:hypothetical protein
MCEKCNSTNTREETKNLNDCSDNIVKFTICQDCGYQKSEIINIQ